MKCKNCGYELSDITNYCPYCGADQRTFAGTENRHFSDARADRFVSDGFRGKPPKKKRPLKMIGIIVVILLLVSNVGRLMGNNATKKDAAVSTDYSKEQGFSGTTAGSEADREKAETAAADEKPGNPSGDTTSGAGKMPATSSDDEGSRKDEKQAASSDDTESGKDEKPAASSGDTGSETGGATPAPDSADSAQNIVDPSLVTPEFKEMMDSYEEWFDSYIEFMRSYQDAGSPGDMMLRYAEFMAQYAEMIVKLDAIDEAELSAGDAAYYLEVTGRIYKKLATIQ